MQNRAEAGALDSWTPRALLPPGTELLFGQGRLLVWSSASLCVQRPATWRPFELDSQLSRQPLALVDMSSVLPPMETVRQFQQIPPGRSEVRLAGYARWRLAVSTRGAAQGAGSSNPSGAAPPRVAPSVLRVGVVKCDL